LRSIAHTVSPCGSANRCCVWSTDAAHLASIVCRQPPKREGKTKIGAESVSHRTRDSDASTSPGGVAAGVPLRTPYRHAVLRIAAAFGPRTPHILRRSCAVSLQNVREKRRLVQKAIRTGRATATRRRRQAASRLAFHCAHRIDMRFCESLLHLVHGRRTSCVVRVSSASKKKALKTARSRYGPDVLMNWDRHWQTS